MAFLNRRSESHRFLCLLLAALTVATPAASMAQQPSTPPRIQVDPSQVRQNSDLLAQSDEPAVDAASILPNACAVIAVRPAQILSSPLLEMFPTEVIQAATIEETGLDPATTEQVVVSATSPGQGPPHYAVTAEFTQPFKLKPESEIAKHTQRAQLDGKNYLKSSQPMLPSYYPLTNTTLLAAPEYTLPLFVKEQTDAAPGQLATQFAAAAKGDDLLAMVDVEALRPLINLGLSQAQADMPAEARPFLEIPNLVKQLELRLNLSRPGVSELLITANNQADADKLVGLFNEAKRMLMSQIAAETSKQLASEDPVERAAAQYSQRMMRLWDQRLQLTQEGARLVLFRAEAGASPNQMVTVATVGVLVALLLPAVQAAREAARRTNSMNNARQIMLALHIYADAQKHFPAQANYDAEGKPLLSWRVHILPYLEQEALYKQFHLDEPWNSEHNKQLISQMPEIYLDPSSRFAPPDGKTHYLGVAGPGHLFDKEGKKLTEITDGTASTIAIVQAGDAGAVTWTQPDDWRPNKENLLKPLGQLHPGGLLAGFCDGHVAIIDYEIDADVLYSLLTIAGGEAVANY